MLTLPSLSQALGHNWDVSTWYLEVYSDWRICRYANDTQDGRSLTAEGKAAGSALITSVKATPQAPKTSQFIYFFFPLAKQHIYPHIKWHDKRNAFPLTKVSSVSSGPAGY